LRAETNPNSAWEQGEIAAHDVVSPADKSKLVGNDQSSTYGVITQQTVQVWKNEAYKTALYGSRAFHSGDELGSEIAVSCDMCQPRAANTHPESYPKFQPQLGRVAMLRDMINWCIEHPVRGEVGRKNKWTEMRLHLTRRSSTGARKLRQYRSRAARRVRSDKIGQQPEVARLGIPFAPD